MLSGIVQSSFLFPSLVGFRMINSLLLKTHFEPDEYYQSVEVAMSILTNKKVFTWEWFFGIRSFVFVCIFLIPLKAFSYFCEFFDKIVRIYCECPPKSSDIFFMIFSPYVIKLITAVVSAVGDYSTIHSYMMLYGVSTVPQEIVLVSLLNIGLWLYSTRSHSNSFESAVSVYVFYRLLKSQNITEKMSKKLDYAVTVAISVIMSYIRPTSLVSLIPMWIMVLVRESQAYDMAWRKKEKIVRSWMKYFYIYVQHSRIISLMNILVGVTSIALCVMIDSVFYQEIVCSPWEFYRININHGISKIFGTLPFIYVIFFCAVLLGAYTPMILLSSVKIFSIEVIIPTVYTIVHGLIAHKEMRFLLPILPYANILIAKTLKETVNHNVRNVKSVTTPFKVLLRKLIFSKYVFLGNLIVAVVIGLDHQNISKPLDYLRRDCSERLTAKNHPIFILSTFCPYMLPMNTYLGHKRIIVRTVDNNPNILSLLEKNKKTKRFQNKEYRLRLLEHDTIDSCMVDNIIRLGALDYHYIIVDGKHSKEFESKLPEFIKVHESTHKRVPSRMTVVIYKQAFK